VCLFVELPLCSALDRDQQYFRDDSSSMSLIREKVVSWRSNADPHFNPKSFLAKVGEARGIGRYRKNYDCAIEMRWIACSTGGIVQFCSDIPRDPV
jgi:hypothetical protein